MSGTNDLNFTHLEEYFKKLKWVDDIKIQDPCNDNGSTDQPLPSGSKEEESSNLADVCKFNFTLQNVKGKQVKMCKSPNELYDFLAKAKEQTNNLRKKTAVTELGNTPAVERYLWTKKIQERCRCPKCSKKMQLMKLEIFKAEQNQNPDVAIMSAPDRLPLRNLEQLEEFDKDLQKNNVLKASVLDCKVNACNLSLDVNQVLLSLFDKNLIRKISFTRNCSKNKIGLLKMEYVTEIIICLIFINYKLKKNEREFNHIEKTINEVLRRFGTRKNKPTHTCTNENPCELRKRYPSCQQS